MSKIPSPPRLRPIAAVVATGALGISCFATFTPAATAAGAPPAPARPGYVAQATCSWEGSPANAGVWLSEPEVGGGYPVLFGHYNSCETGGYMTLRDEASRDSEPDTGPMYVYEAPPGTLIAGGHIKYTMTSPGGKASLEAPRQSPNGPLVLASCDSSCTGVHGGTVPIPDTEWWLLWARAECVPATGQPKCTTGAVNSELSISEAVVLLHSEATPEAIGLSGSLTESPVSGNASVKFTAKEHQGTGIYRVTAQVDGSTVWAQTPDTDFGQCVPHGTYEGALVFTSGTPCKEEVPVHIELPTGTIADGPHLVEVAVEDAAGDRSVVFDRTITFANHPGAATGGGSQPATGAPAPAAPTPPTRGPANGSPASEQATLSASWLTGAGKPTKGSHLASSYGHVQKVSGRLTDPGGAPISGAAIEVTATPDALGATAASVTVVRTAADGTFTAKLPASLSAGTVTFAYRSHLGDPLPAASTRLSVSMPASVHISVVKTRTPYTVGKTVAMVGKLAGPIPPGGKQVVFEGRAVGGSWVEFKTTSTDEHGIFHGGHKFKFAGPARYEFRAVCKHEADFPFAQGTSNTVHIKEH